MRFLNDLLFFCNTRNGSGREVRHRQTQINADADEQLGCDVGKQTLRVTHPQKRLSWMIPLSDLLTPGHTSL